MLVLKNNTVEKYVKNTALSNQNTAYEYRKRLDSFGLFIQHDYSLSLDELITTLTTTSRGPKIDVYDMLSNYVSYLHNNGKVSPITIKQRLSTARSYLETFDVDISPGKFKVKVKMPLVIQTTKEALAKEDIINILNACSSIKLRTYVLFLAATGCRATEAVSTRMCDFNFEISPARVFIRGEFTKTRTDRYVFLTKELVQQLKLWFDFKYRTRNIGYYDRVTRTSTNDKRTPVVDNEQFLFSTIHSRNPTIDSLYINLLTAFEHTLDRLGGKYGEYETIKKRRRKITLHSFRRRVKSTISDLGHGDYSEYFIGHSGSTYYRKTEKEKAELFNKIEPYLTYLDFASLERKGADIQTKMDTFEKENKLLREEQKIKEDRLAIVEQQFSVMQSQMQSLLSSLGSMQDQNQVNQMAKTLYNSKIITKEDG